MCTLDILVKVATVIIALFNVVFTVIIFRFKTNKDNKEKDCDRNIQLLKTLVLDHNLSNYYQIFEHIEHHLIALKSEQLTLPIKQEIDLKLADYFIQLRNKFYDILLAIDDALYERIKTEIDGLQTNLIDTIFDPGINLNHTPKYDELITQKLVVTKTEIIRMLFQYRG
ncbi:MAG TPA: hypothetical protein VL053_09500 [Arachidicoccus sp.]|nr:hypothetical protein [Arachidicoccus sp.]